MFINFLLKLSKIFYMNENKLIKFCDFLVHLRKHSIFGLLPAKLWIDYEFFYANV